MLRLDRPSADSIVFGSTSHLSGVGRGLAAPRLASSPDGAAWTGAGTLTPDAVGAISVDVKPARTLRYRLEAEGGASPALLVQVAPRITLARPTQVEPTVLSGTVRPRLPGAVVAVERRKGTAWVTLGETTVDAAGTFRLELDAIVPTGSYRARMSATEGLAAGVSAVVQVSA